jgi:hypothetical protein
MYHQLDIMSAYQRPIKHNKFPPSHKNTKISAIVRGHHNSKLQTPKRQIKRRKINEKIK